MDDKIRDYKIRRIKRLVDKLNKDDADFEAKHKRDKNGRFSAYSNNSITGEGKPKGVKFTPLSPEKSRDMEEHNSEENNMYLRAKLWRESHNEKAENKESDALIEKKHNLASKKVERPKKNTFVFRDEQTYDDFYGDPEYYYDNVNVVNVLDDPSRSRVEADGEFDCKSWKTAIRRFYDGLPDGKFKDCIYGGADGWIDRIEEGIKLRDRALKAKERGQRYEPELLAQDPFVDDGENGWRIGVEFPGDEGCYISMIIPRRFMEDS